MSLRTARGWIGLFRGVLVGTAAGTSFVLALNEPEKGGGGQSDLVAREMAQARASLERGTSQIAVNRLESLLQDPGLSAIQVAEVRSLLARAFVRLGLPERARGLREQLPLAAFQGESSAAILADGCMAFAEAHMELGRYHEAAEWYLKARETGGDPLVSAIGYGSALALEGRPVEAQAALQKGLELAGSGAEANEGAVKLARRWGSRRKGEAFEIIGFEDGFLHIFVFAMAFLGLAINLIGEENIEQLPFDLHGGR